MRYFELFCRRFPFSGCLTFFVLSYNYSQIKLDVKQIVADELRRIEEDPELQHLRKKE
jgi:hypothetical protein